MVAKVNFSDTDLFGNDAGEEEDVAILAAYFLDKESFAPFLDGANRIYFARARKGMGKSALLAKLDHDLRISPKPPLVIRVTGADLTGLGEFASADPAVLVNQWQQVICARITQEIGARIGIAVSERSTLMVEAAELAGFKDRNLLRGLIDRLELKLEGLPVKPQRIGAPNVFELLRRYQADAPSDVWFLIDDIDATFIDRPDQRLKLGTFFSACRKIAREVKGLKVRASVRTDVWSVIRDNEDLDKCEQYMIDILWTKGEMGVLLAKRIFAYLLRKNPAYVKGLLPNSDTQKIIEFAFQGRIGWGGQRVPPVQALNILSARRPRWLAQLCRLAGLEAKRLGSDLIGGQHITAVLKKFGDLRLGDLKKEHSHQFADLTHLIETFAGGDRRYKTNELFARIQERYLGPMASKGIPRIEGAVVTSPKVLAHFLFKIGFLQAQGRDEQTFVDFEDRPDLLTSEVNLDDGLEWAVYPSYRNVLRIK